MPGLLRGMARTAVVAGTATAASNRVSRRQAQRWGAEEQQAQPQPVAPPPAANDEVAQLQQLAQLKDQDVYKRQV